MTYVKKTLDEITPYEFNPRKNDNAVSAVAESITQCTYINPIIIDEDGVILAGHTRYKALRKLGINEAMCIVAEGLTEEQKKKYRYLDNRTNEFAQWDLPKLNQELEQIDLKNLDFFDMEQESFEVQIDSDGEEKKNEKVGATEFDIEDYDDEKFKYECPECGFKFN